MDPHYPGGAGSVAAIGRHPLHPLLVPLPIGMFIAALVADIVYASTVDPFWARASYWLLIGGIIAALVAAIAGAIELFGVPRARKLGLAWAHAGINLVVVAIAVVNVLLRVTDKEAEVVPTGLILSIVMVLGLAVSGWLGGELSFRHGIGVSTSIGGRSVSGRSDNVGR